MGQCTFKSFDYKKPDSEQGANAASYDFDIVFAWGPIGQNRFSVTGSFNQVTQFYTVMMRVPAIADALKLRGLDMRGVLLTGTFKLHGDENPVMTLAVQRAGIARGINGKISSNGIFFRFPLRMSYNDLRRTLPPGLRGDMETMKSQEFDTTREVIVQYGQDPSSKEFSGASNTRGQARITYGGCEVSPWPGKEALRDCITPMSTPLEGTVGRATSVTDWYIPDENDNDEETAEDSTGAGWQMLDYEVERPSLPEWGWNQTWGDADLFAGFETTLDYGMDLSSAASSTTLDQTENVDATFFSGAAAFVQAFQTRYNFLDTYAKVSGGVDAETCQAMQEDSTRVFTEAQQARNEVQYGGYMAFHNPATKRSTKYSLSFQKQLCSSGDPCLPQDAAAPELIHTMGSFELLLFL